MSDVRLSSIIAQPFRAMAHDILHNHAYTHYDLRGGRGSTKSSFISLMVPLILLQHPQAHALVLRKVGNTIRDSVYAQYVWALDQLGILEYFKATVSPPELTYIPTGQKIMFRGADKPEKIKSIKVPFGYIAVTHFEEKDQFAGRAEIRNILQSTMRGGSEYWNFESYNPPISRDNWANLDSLEQRPDRLTHSSTYLDVPPEWLGEQFIFEAETLKRTNERAYQHEYLGLPVGTGGQVFDNLEIRPITGDEIKTFGWTYAGLDWGWYPDPTQFVRCSYDTRTLTLYIYDEWRTVKTTNAEIYRHLVDDKKLKPDEEIIADSAEPKSVNDLRNYGARCTAAVKGPQSVTTSLKWLQMRHKIVIDPARCPFAAKEFSSYEYEKTKNGDIVAAYPDANNHAIDAVRYALNRVWMRAGM